MASESIPSERMWVICVINSTPGIREIRNRSTRRPNRPRAMAMRNIRDRCIGKDGRVFREPAEWRSPYRADLPIRFDIGKSQASIDSANVNAAIYFISPW